MIDNAWLLVEDGRIAGFGGGDEAAPGGADEVVDCEGGLLMPAFCDSHTHIVYAGCRDGEFLDKIRGLSYEEIAAHGGGILNSADLLHQTSEDELFRQSMERVNEMIAQGTGALEIKSGYGLNPIDEMKMLRVIDRIKAASPALIRTTFLGAHAVGRGYSHDDYVATVCRMMPEAARYADFVDIFCEEGFFTVEDAARVLEAGLRAGLRPKIHANQLAVSGGVQVGVRYGALSVDHLEKSGAAEIEALRGAATMPTFLPAGFGVLPPDSRRPGPRLHRRRPGRRSGFRLQSGLLAFRRYAFHLGSGLHPDAAHAQPGLQRRDPQQRLRDGRERPVRFDHRRQARRPDPDPPGLESHEDSLPPPLAVHPASLSPG